jgi:hypothetical protein
MRFTSSIVARLIRLLSASAVRIALSATLTTPQPAVAFHGVAVTRQQQLAPLVLAAGQAGASDNTAESRDTPPPSGLGGPGPGWG